MPMCRRLNKSAENKGIRMKRKILIIVNSLSVNGILRYLALVLGKIDLDRADVTLYVRRPAGGFLEPIDERINIVHKKNKRQKVKRELRHYFKKVEYDAAISFSQGEALYLLKHINAKEKYLFWYRINTETACDFDFIDKIITAGINSKSVLEALCPQYENKIDIIEGYIDIEALRQRAMPSIPKAYSPILISTLGRVTGTKGFDLAIKAAAVLADKGLDFEWYFIGDDEESEELKKLIEINNVGDKIVIKGKMENPYPYIGHSDIYVQPSREESMAFSIKEALALCKPVVATRTVASIECISHGLTGVLTEPDENAIAMGILKYCEDTAFKERILQNLKFTDYTEKERVFTEKWQALINGRTFSK